MEYKNGELLYVCKGYRHDSMNNWEDGVFVLYMASYEGKEDLSHHGIPWYEEFIICESIDSRERVEFGSQSYCWRSASEYIKTMQNKLKEINRLANVR